MAALTAISISLAASAEDPKAGPLEGTWKATSVVKEGMPELEDGATGTITFTGNKVTLRFRKRDDSGTFTIDPKATPATIDITVRYGDKGKEHHAKGIYKVENDTLTICLALDEGERPKDFNPAKTNIVSTLKRVKK